MKILHVSLGLPPFRTGGLNRYCADLMDEQVKQGDTVALLCPGNFTFYGKTRLQKVRNKKFDIYKIINPLPVALVNGVSDPKRYMLPCSNPEIYKIFLAHERPDIIHVHSIQGIHKEFFEAAREMRFKIVFTTHDYYPICLRCILLYRDGSLCCGPDGKKCSQCNYGQGLSRVQEWMMQSRLYENIKYSFIVKKLRGRIVKSKMLKETQVQQEEKMLDVSQRIEGEYASLLAYYQKILSCFDVIHCNSEIANLVYKQFVAPNKCKIFGITHANIYVKPHRQQLDRLRLGYVGGLNRYKGLNILLKATEILDRQNVDYQLLLYGADFSEYTAQNPHVFNGGIYTCIDEDKVWNSFDVLVVPSQCRETYGFVVLEALAHSVAVVCSDLVGAKMLLNREDIFRHDSPDDLARCLLQKHSIQSLKEKDFRMDRHAKQLKCYIYQEKDVLK